MLINHLKRIRIIFSRFLVLFITPRFQITCHFWPFDTNSDTSQPCLTIQGRRLYFETVELFVKLIWVFPRSDFSLNITKRQPCHSNLHAYGFLVILPNDFAFAVVQQVLVHETDTCDCIYAILSKFYRSQHVDVLVVWRPSQYPCFIDNKYLHNIYSFTIG